MSSSIRPHHTMKKHKIPLGKFRLWAFPVFMVLCVAPCAYGQERTTKPAKEPASKLTQIQGKALRDTFLEATIYSEYRRHKGMHNKSFDFTEHHNTNGTTDYTELGSPTEQGIWNIIGDNKICYRYPASEHPQRIHCFFIFKDGKCYYNYAASAMRPIMKQNTIQFQPRSWDRWIARFVRKGDGGSCGGDVG